MACLSVLYHPKPSVFFVSPFSPPPPPCQLQLLCPTTRTILSVSNSSCRLIACSVSPSDHASLLHPPADASRPLKIAIIGFGNYGQFLARSIISQGHQVLAYSRSDHSHVAEKLGASFYSDPDDLCEQHPEVVLLCTSIISTEKVVKSLPLQRLKRSTLFVDVLSVKEFAKKLLLDALPPDFDIICSHPMFGPQSAKHGWSGLPFVYEKVRIGADESRISRCNDFLSIFEREGCRMVEMSCREHDRFAAGSQFMTHTVGRVLEMLELKSTPINTKGYEALLDLVENTCMDSFDLYYGLFLFNNSALEMLKRLDLAFDSMRNELLERLHDIVTTQLFEDAERRQTYLNCAASEPTLSVLRAGFNAPAYECLPRVFNHVNESSKLKIAVVGFGNFGQFLAKTIINHGHNVLAYSRTDYSDVAEKMGISFFSDADDLCEEHPDVILLCTSIISTETVLMSLPLQRLKRSTLFVDVLSVKEFPRNLFLQHLPSDFDILCTHPMFGPESGKKGWHDLPLVFDKVRIGSDQERLSRCNSFLDIFAREGCLMVEMSCAEHDWHAAGSQFITHTMGRVLEKLGLESTPINTKGYETLLKLVENTAGDSFDLYYGLFMYNINSMEQLERLDLAFELLKKHLFGRLHGVLRKQLFGNGEHLKTSKDKSVAMDGNDVALPSSLASLRSD